MSKIPILLSAAAVLVGSAGSIPSIVSAQSTGENRANSPLSLAQHTLAAQEPGVNLGTRTLGMYSLSSRSVGTDLSLDAYQQYPYFRINFDFANNWADIVTDMPLNEGDWLSWITLAYRDVDNGVTEAEADAQMATLAKDKVDWAVILQNQAVNPRSYTFALSLKRAMSLEMNPTDIIYYAVQFTNRQTGNSYWFRGKLDYRRCRHSAGFAELEQKVCYATTNDDKQQIEYAILRNGHFEVAPEDEQILSWEEEWTQYLEKRVTTLAQRVAELEAVLSDAQGELFEAEQKLDTTEQKLSLTEEKLSTTEQKFGVAEQKLEATEQELTEVRRALSSAEENLSKAEQAAAATKKQLAATKEELARQQQAVLEKDGLLTQREAEIARLEAELEQLKQGGSTSTQDTARLEAENRGLRAEAQKITEENQRLKQQISQQNNDYTAAKQELERQNGELSTKNKNLENTLRVAEAQGKELKDTAQTAEKHASELENALQASQARGQELTEKLATRERELTEKIAAQEQELTERLAAQERALTEKLATRKQETVGESATTGPTGAVAESEQASQEARSDQAPQDAKTGQGAQETKATQTPQATEPEQSDVQASTTEDEAVEVPDLGKTTVKLNIWWIIIGVVGSFSAALLWLKRSFRMKP